MKLRRRTAQQHRWQFLQCDESSSGDMRQKIAGQHNIVIILFFNYKERHFGTLTVRGIVADTYLKISRKITLFN
jgi:hypothetical protein